MRTVAACHAANAVVVLHLLLSLCLGSNEQPFTKEQSDAYRNRSRRTCLLLILFIMFSGISSWKSGHSTRLSPALASGTKADLVSNRPLTIKGCLSEGVNKNRVILEFKNNTLWSLRDIRITKVRLGGRFPLSNKLPIVIKAIGGRKDLQLVLEFSRVSSRYFELEIEYRGGIGLKG